MNLELSEHVIEAHDRSFKGSTTTIVDLGTYIFKDLDTGKNTPEESFTNAYVEKVYESEHLSTSNKQLSVILDAKFEK